MIINKAIASLFVASALGMLALGAAKADINPSSPVPTITGSGPYTYTYGLEVSGTQTVNTGDFFTFYDVNGLVAGSEATTATGFVSSESLLGPTATGASGTVVPVDSASLENVTFTYTGTTPIVGLQGLGDFSFKSIYNVGTTIDAFTGRATLSGSTIKNANLTSYLGPTTGVSTVPEPATIAPFALGALGLLALGFRARKTSRTGAAA